MSMEPCFWRFAGSDVHGSAQSRKPAEAEPKIAEPEQAVVPALEGLRLRLTPPKAVGRGPSHGFQ